MGKLANLYYTDGMRWMPLHALALFSLATACNVNSQPGSASAEPVCPTTAPANGDPCSGLQICWYADPTCGDSTACATKLFAYCDGGPALYTTWLVTTEVVSPDAETDASMDVDAAEIVDGQQQGEVVDGQQQGEVADSIEVASEVADSIEVASDVTDSSEFAVDADAETFVETSLETSVGADVSAPDAVSDAPEAEAP